MRLLCAITAIALIAPGGTALAGGLTLAALAFMAGPFWRAVTAAGVPASAAARDRSTDA